MDYLVIRSAGAAMGVPEGYVQPEVSERKAAPGALPGHADPGEILSVTVGMHRPPATSPSPTAPSWAAVLLANGPARATALISVANGRLFGVGA